MMDYNILINEYLEGTLDAEQESQLFLALSSSDELRKEMRQSIELDKGLGKRVSAFVPSSASTVNLFTQLGIGTAVGAASTAAALGFKHTLLTFFSTYSQAVITGLIAVAVTAGSFLAFYNPSDEVILAIDKYQNSSNNGNNNNSESTQNGLLTFSDNDVKTEQFKTDTVIKYITLSNVGSKETEKNLDTDYENKLSDIPEHSVKKIYIAQESRPITSNLYSESDMGLISNTELPHSDYSPSDINISLKKMLNTSLEVKGNGYWSIPKPDVPQYNTPTFSNIQLSLLYHLSDDFKAGIDFRQESFYQNFTGTNEIGEDFIYKQYPAYYSLSLMGRYTFWSENMYSTFGQMSLGGTATGLVSRLMFGLEISPISSLSFIVGLEGSMLTYIHQDNLFNSPKLGLNYGVSFNF